MKHIRKILTFGAALIVLLMLATVARARAVQDWYRTVTVQSRSTMWLLDDRARVNGLLLEDGSQIRISPRLAEAVVARGHLGDTVSVVGRGGSRSSFGRVVHARTLTINGQTLTAFEEPGPGPRLGSPHGPGRGDAPPPSPREAGRGHVPPPPPPPHAGAIATPATPGAADAPPPAPPTPPTPSVGPGTDREVAAPPAPRDGTPGPVPPNAPAPPPPAANRVTARGKVQGFLVGERGEIVGLALDTGEQVRIAPPVGEQLTASSTNPHPDVVVEGDAVHSEQGTIIRATEITIGAQTMIVQ